MFYVKDKFRSNNCLVVFLAIPEPEWLAMVASSFVQVELSFSLCSDVGNTWNTNHVCLLGIKVSALYIH